jgi:hypothetical protein
MPGGRPTADPKGKLVAVRLAARHVRLLERRAAAERVSVSEALRRYLDEQVARTPAAARGRAPTPEERATFDQVFAAFGLRSKRRRGER